MRSFKHWLTLFSMLGLGALTGVMTPQAQPGSTQDAALRALVAGNTAFAFDLYRAVSGQASANENLIFSPYSISQAFAMAYGGARGDTARQMATALRFTLEPAALHTAFAALTADLASRADGGAGFGMEGEGGQRLKLNIANALWGQRGYAFQPEYLALLADAYDAGLREVDFRADPEAVRVTINDWVAEQTEDKIRDIIPPDTLNEFTRLVLANAIYFNASWQNSFPEFLTADAPFNLIDGSTVETPTMNQQERLGYARGEGYQLVSLPYLGYEVSMLIFVPDTGNFADFEAGLDADSFTAVVAALSGRTVNLYLPRFTVAYSLGLTPALESLGMTDAFDPTRADFSGMIAAGADPLALDAALHKAFIRLDEEGTEAAAATALMFGATSAQMPEEIIELRVDRPFLYAIYDEVTGSVLFIGRVMNPAADG